MFEVFVNALLNFSESIGYWGILLLMTIESSFIPFPSEIVVPPAAYLAQQGEFNIYLVILFGILGSLAGALINYYLALWLGRPVVYKIVNKGFMRFFLLNEIKIYKAEKYFLKYGNISTFVGRLIPGVRQLISLPAGFSKMPMKSFLFYTFLGSGIWTAILALQGYLVGVYKDIVIQYFPYIILGFVLGGVLIYVVVKYFRKG